MPVNYYAVPHSKPLSSLLSWKVLSLILILSPFYGELAGQQVTSFSFYSSHINYSKSDHSLLLQGYPESFLDNGVYKFNLNERTLEKLDELAEYTRFQLSPDGSRLYASSNTAFDVFSYPDVSMLYAVNNTGNSFNRFTISPLDPDLIVYFEGGVFRMFKNGQELPNNVPGLGSYLEVVFDEEKNFMYAKNNQNTGYTFIRLAYDEQGVYEPGTPYGFHYDDSQLYYYNNKIFSDDGTVIDVSSEPKLHGHIGARQQNLTTSTAYHFAFQIHEWDGTLLDPDNNACIYIGKLNNHLALIHFDMETLQLKQVQETMAPILVPSNNPSIGRWEGGFAYNYNGQIVLVEQGCNESFTEPLLNTSYEDVIYTCGYEYPLLPPSGYTHLYDETGLQHDTLWISDDNNYTFRVRNEEGCLSEPSKEIYFKRTFPPNKPFILSLKENGFKQATEANRCNDLPLSFKAQESGFGTIHYLWPDGETKDEISYQGSENKIWVHAVGENDCLSEASDTIIINPSTNDGPLIPEINFPNINEHICSNQAVQLESKDEYQAYYWTDESSNFENFNKSISIDSPGFTYLQVMTENGCWSEKQKHQIKIDLIGGVVNPIISESQNIISSNIPSDRFRWYKDGALLIENKLPVFEASSPGVYQLRIGSGLCWSGLSNEIIIE